MEPAARSARRMIVGTVALTVAFIVWRVVDARRGVEVPEVPAGAVSDRVRIVEPGETLWSIAREELGDGRRWRELATANGIVDPSQLRIGHRLVVR